MLFALKALNQTTGQTLDERLEAPSPDAAAQAARQRGLDVLQLTPLPDPTPSPVLDYHTPPSAPFPLRTRRKIVRLMLLAEVLPLVGIIVWIFVATEPSDYQPRLFGILAALAFLIIQWGILAPVTRPRASAGPAKSPWYWLSAIALGLVLGLVVMFALFLAADLYWATHDDFSNSQLNAALLVAVFLAAASWLLSVPLIMAFMKRGRPESFMARLAAALFLGSAVEVIAAVPILELVRRRDSCTCSHATFWTIFLSIATGFIVLGPMVFLVILARRTRAASHGVCPVCGTDLRKLPDPDPCPQCGAGWKAPPS
jgi:hypothetical protein